jgi:digeranylgeranylglycerophospholipid reductase
MEAKRSGAKLIMSCRVLDVKWYRSGDIKVITDSKNLFQAFTTKMVIFADGVNTLAYRTMGIGFRKRANNTAFGIVYEFEYPGNMMTDYYIFFNPKGLTRCGYSWVIPKKDTLNVGVYLFEHEFRNHPYKKTILENYVDTEDTEFASLLKGRRVIKKLGAHIPLVVAARLYSDSALTVGDAAGLVSPLTGAGIHFALSSGRLAGLTANQALEKGDFSNKTLYEYEKTVVGSLAYKNIKKESFIFKFCSRAARIDPNIYSKLFHLYKLRRDFSLLNNLKIASYPFAQASGKTLFE